MLSLTLNILALFMHESRSTVEVASTLQLLARSSSALGYEGVSRLHLVRGLRLCGLNCSGSKSFSEKDPTVLRTELLQSPNTSRRPLRQSYRRSGFCNSFIALSIEAESCQTTPLPPFTLPLANSQVIQKVTFCTSNRELP